MTADMTAPTEPVISVEECVAWLRGIQWEEGCDHARDSMVIHTIQDHLRVLDTAEYREMERAWRALEAFKRRHRDTFNPETQLAAIKALINVAHDASEKWCTLIQGSPGDE